MTQLVSGTQRFGDATNYAEFSSTGNLTLGGTGSITMPYAGIYIYDGVTAQTLAAGSTPILLTGFNTAAGANGLSAGATSDKANNKITVTTQGRYQIQYAVTFTGVTGVSYEFYPYAGATQIVSAGAVGRVNAGGDSVCITAFGLANVAANTDVTLKAYHDNVVSRDITLTHANLVVRYVGAYV